jgi:NADPH:quinone reductase
MNQESHGNLARKGGYAEYAVTTAHSISRIPDAISFEEAAALPCAGYTAYQALHRKLRVREGESILIHGGAGGVGGFAV